MITSLTTLDHVSVTVSDLERSLAFYRDTLGLKEVERHRLEGETISTMVAKAHVVMQVVRLVAPETPGIMIDLQQYVEPGGSISTAQLGDVAHSHFCFGVKDMGNACRELRERGVELVSDPVVFHLSSGELKVVFLKDPDGFVLELVEYPESTD